MQKSVSVAIVGASLAGSSLALRLAKQGIDVALFDQANFPRRKACGEGLSILGIEKFVELGLGRELFNLTHADFFGYSFHQSPKQRFSLCFAEQQGERLKGLGVSRYLLDQMLLKAALAYQQVSFFPQEKIVNIIRLAEGFLVNGLQHSIRARYLVLACGAASDLPRKLKIPEIEAGSRRFGISMEVKEIGASALEPGMVNIFNESGMQVMLTPIDAQRFNLSAVISKPYAERGIHWRERIEQLLAKHEVQFCALTEPLGAGRIGRFKRVPFFQDAFMIGDCLEQFDPVGGMGMTHALLSAEITAQSLIQILVSPKKSQKAILNTHLRCLGNEKRPLRGFTRLSYLHMLQAGLVGMKHSRYLQPLAQRVVNAVSSLGQTDRDTSMLGMLLVNLSGVNLWNF